MIRPLTPADVEAADAIAAGHFDRPSSPFHLDRVRHLAETDPGGAWVAQDDEGAITGLALALVREGLWGLSLFAVDAAHHGLGLGRALLQAAHAHGEGCHAHLILSSEHPAALRLYASLGLELRPVVDAAGVADLTRMPDLAGRVEATDELDVADAIGRAVRGAGHARDLPVALRNGSALLVLEDRAFALVKDGGGVAMVAGRDEEAAAAVLWAGMAHGPRGATTSAEFLDARQQWAIRAVLDAGLALTPSGATFVGGTPGGPLTPYLPSGAFL